jgi:hypothetical protein
MTTYNYVHYAYQTPEQYYADTLDGSAVPFDTYRDAKTYVEEQNSTLGEDDLPYHVYVQMVLIEE